MGVLDAFDAGSEKAEYERLLKAEDVVSGQSGMIAGVTEVQLEGGKKPAVILEGKWKDSNGATKRALVLKRTNGNELARMARKAGGESALRGSFVILTLGQTWFRGKEVPTIDLRETPPNGSA